MEPYIGIVVFELESAAGGARQGETMTKAQESTDAPAVTLRHIVDVAPALDGTVDGDVDLYARHFASLEDYACFEMKLGGCDPFG